MVITGRTRNALALRGTRVRIPPSPLLQKAAAHAGAFLYEKNSIKFPDLCTIFCKAFEINQQKGL